MEECKAGKRRNYKKYLVAVNFSLDKLVEKKESLQTKLERAESNQSLLENSERNLLFKFASLRDTEERWSQNKQQNMIDKRNSLENQKLETFTKAYLENLEEIRTKLLKKIEKIQNSKEHYSLKNSKIDAKISKLESEIGKTKKKGNFHEISLEFSKKCCFVFDDVKKQSLSLSGKLSQIISDNQIMENEVFLEEVANSMQNLSSKSERLNSKIQQQKKKSDEIFDLVYANEEKIKKSGQKDEKFRLGCLGSQNKIMNEWMDSKVNFLRRKLKYIDSVCKEKTTSKILKPFSANLENSASEQGIQSKYGNFNEAVEKKLSIVFEEYEKVMETFIEDRIDHKRNKIKLLVWIAIKDFNEDLMAPKVEGDNTEEEKCDMEILEILKELFNKTEGKIEKNRQILEQLNKKIGVSKTGVMENSYEGLRKLAKDCEGDVEEYFSLRRTSLALGELSLKRENLKIIDQRIAELLKKRSEISSIIEDLS